MDLKMSISDMLKYRDILQEKAEVARAQGKTTILNAVLQRIDAIMVVIDAAFMYTITENAPKLVKFIDVKMFDPEALKLVLPGMRKDLPMQGTIQFEVVEELSNGGESTPSSLKGQLQAIVERNFVSKIPQAIAKYRELTGSKEPDSIAWIKIKEILDDKRIIAGWDSYITGKLVNQGPIAAFYAIKKHLNDWSDMDISILMNDAAKRTAGRIPNEEDSKKLNNRTFGIMDKFPANIRDYLNDPTTVDVIKTYAKIDDRTRMGQHLAQLSQVIAPSKRAAILTRKEYVEKGY